MLAGRIYIVFCKARGLRGASFRRILMRSYFLGVLCATAMATSAFAQTLTIGVRGGPERRRSTVRHVQ